MGKWINAFIARHAPAFGNATIVSLKAQLAEAQMESERRLNNYLVLVDESTNLRTAYSRLAFERLRAWGIERAGGVEHPEKAKGLAGHRRRSAPTAGDRKA
ncbi:MAG: hypothetical protein ABI036_14145 [Fibrobacteria bacterium]